MPHTTVESQGGLWELQGQCRAVAWPQTHWKLCHWHLQCCLTSLPRLLLRLPSKALPLAAHLGYFLSYSEICSFGISQGTIPTSELLPSLSSFHSAVRAQALHALHLCFCTRAVAGGPQSFLLGLLSWPVCHSTAFICGTAYRRDLSPPQADCSPCWHNTSVTGSLFRRLCCASEPAFFPFIFVFNLVCECFAICIFVHTCPQRPEEDTRSSRSYTQLWATI